MGALRAEIEQNDGLVKPVYWLQVGDGEIRLDPAQQPGMQFRWQGRALCQHCGATLRNPSNGGFCYTCFTTLARCDLCVLSPERCHAHLNTCREPDWGERFCMQPHIVYLANSSHPKVGITRAERSVGRWVDQGATTGLVIADAPTRRAAGVIEHHFKSRIADKTDWRKLVTGYTQPGNLLDHAQALRDFCPQLASIPTTILPADERAAMHWRDVWHVTEIQYPIQAYASAQRIQVYADSPEFRDNLLGVVGRYLLFQSGALAVDAHQFGDVEVAVGASFDPDLLPKAAQGSLF